MNRLLLFVGPAAALALFILLTGQAWSFPPAATAAVALLRALWWIFEPIPIPFTSLIPLGIFPLLGILSPT